MVAQVYFMENAQHGPETVTIYVSKQELEVFKSVTKNDFRQEAGQLAAIAQKAVESGNFRIIPLPKGERRSYQIKTKWAAPYLVELRRRLTEEGKDASFADIVESLIRALSLQ